MKMTDKDILLACKSDNPIQDLMESYGYDSKTALFEDIEKLYPVACGSLIRALSKKNNVPELTPEESEEPVLEESEELVSEESEEPVSEESEEPVPEESEESVPEESEEPVLEESEESVLEESEESVLEESEELVSEESEEPVLEESEEPTSEDGTVVSDELAKLKQMEENLSKKVIGFESQIKDLNGERSKNCVTAKKALLELQKIIRYQEENLTNIVTEMSEINVEIDKIKVAKAEAKAELEKVRTRINILQKVTIRVLKDATISIDNKNAPKIDELEYTKNFSKIFALPKAGKLRVDDVRALATLLEIVKQYESYEIIFANPKMQKIWESIK